MKYDRYELKALKVVKAMSEETTCFTADLWVDGKKFAHVSNDGQGGSNRVMPYPPNKWADIETVTQDMLSDPALVLPGGYEPFDSAIGSLLSMAEDYKFIYRNLPTAVLWYNDQGDLSQIAYKPKAPVDDRLIDSVARKYPDAKLLNRCEDIVSEVARASAVRVKAFDEELASIRASRPSQTP